jgi:hypothetical protein
MTDDIERNETLAVTANLQPTCSRCGLPLAKTQGQLIDFLYCYPCSLRSGTLAAPSISSSTPDLDARVDELLGRGTVGRLHNAGIACCDAERLTKLEALASAAMAESSYLDHWSTDDTYEAVQNLYKMSGDN